MAACGSLLTENITIMPTLIDCFELIVRNHHDAIKMIKSVHKNGMDIFSHLGFRYLRNENWTEFCECWFEFEYFDFIQEKCIDETTLQNVLHNLRNGVCPHVKSTVKERENVKVGETNEVQPHLTSVSLFHAAAASGNKKCLKYLLTKVEYSDHFRHPKRSKCGLLPEQIAVMKDRKRTFELLKKYHFESIGLSGNNPMLDVTTFAKRLKSNKIAVITNDGYNSLARHNGIISEGSYSHYNASVLTVFKVSNNFSVKMLNTAILDSYTAQSDLNDLVTHFLFYGKFDTATQILSNGRVKGLQLDNKLIMIVCILNDAEDVLSHVLERNINIHELVFEYNFMDIAIAFGRNKCIFHGKFSKLLKPSNILAKKSPYTFMIRLSQTYNWDDTITSFLFSLCEGHDINHQDANKMTPLHHAIDRLGYHPVIIPVLLELGADVNIRDIKGRTAVVAAIKTYESPLLSDWGDCSSCWPRALLKEILFGNPDPEFNLSIMATALHDDLNNKYLTRITQASKVVIRDRPYPGKGGKYQDGIEVTLSETEQVLAVSFTALLVEFGFKMTAQDYKYIYSLQQDSYHQNNIAFLSAYLKKSQDIPSTLKDACRLTIRRYYPSSLLHKMLIKISIPKQIEEYILFADRLKFVEYEVDGPCGEGKKWYHVDALPYTYNKGLKDLMY